MSEKQEIWTVLKVLTWTKGYLAQKGVENARLESEWLLCGVLDLDRVGLYLNFDKPLTEAELARLRGMVARRARREPLQYILGSQEFMGLEFAVTPAVLIPRHDTEVLVAEAVQRAADGSRILDIGVGSGCIAIALAKVLPRAEVMGVEASPEALALAEKNIEANAVRVTLFEGSLFEPFPTERFDLIVSNPPYIPTVDLESLQPEVRDFEPRQALDGGADGLDFYRLITPAAPSHLNPGGWLLFEVGIGQAAAVKGLLERTCVFTDIFTARDPSGIERVVGGRLA
ncbi:peptide chain release factor N(5)-glutamine methyltransferase [Geomobilimonas luticola]|uniref:Release factor glutamine methyltransferase n=1 Tax=Geomobilimonas luticola TaxID=1114878 RepID=A0ABS5SDU9_9BACT|nr:peptide chain release factor N(5)-glutamine methyltransferase [Geomobilimonas luticola]MBT0653345.1 peptide chain release factor N(5)-glutamine methyltransferase [Geomobilimonas luticola]